VALYLGIDMLSHLQDDAAAAESLLGVAAGNAALAQALITPKGSG
jgi:hypothetical protein